MKNLKQLLGICEHKWNEIKFINVKDIKAGETTPHAFEYHLKCEKCGDIKKVRV